MVTNPNA
eukprot:gene16865-22352_t